MVVEEDGEGVWGERKEEGIFVRGEGDETAECLRGMGVEEVSSWTANEGSLGSREEVEDLL